MTQAEIDLLGSVIRSALAPIRARLDELERRDVTAALQRIEKLERDLSGFVYRGVWDSKVTYQRNNFATHSGSLWIATEGSVGSRPGEQNLSWQLCTKRGKDGR